MQDAIKDANMFDVDNKIEEFKGDQKIHKKTGSSRKSGSKRLRSSRMIN